ncbi:ribosomal L14, mitochondrial [Podarcis lilfordi]|uniref:Large ribosomal subunit protein uL14m n=1 Tax=Podarcis lilfordi TaxID=74358 RepID=A0AA35K316_9SAUR|nr:ribosomal L14, mitochondrial [Podarcis lilfordi]
MMLAIQSLMGACDHLSGSGHDCACYMHALKGYFMGLVAAADVISKKWVDCNTTSPLYNWGSLGPRSLFFKTRILMALWKKYPELFLAQINRATNQRNFSISGACSAIQKMTRVRVVDNSALGNTPYHRPPKCIHVYNKNGVGKVGDKILLAIKGEKKKALIVGHKMPGPRMTPRFDSNNVVLIEDNGNPVGTRIKTPIPSLLRKRQEFSKVLAIAQNFV